MSKLSTRDAIVAAANRLFYREGIRAVSVDAVAAEAGITKKSLYYHFRSKDDLVSAYLAYRDQPNLAAYRNWYDEAKGTPADRVKAIFDHLAVAASHPNWKGCGFIRTSVELADMPGHPALEIGRQHKKSFEAWIAEKLMAAGLRNAEDLSRQVMLLLDGSFSVAMLHRDSGYMYSAGRAAHALVCQAQSD